MTVALILLAAGGSTRMGTPKQLLLYKGKTLIHRVAEAAVDSGCSPIVIVLGNAADQLRSELKNLPVETTINPEWQNGIGSSIAAGITHLENITQAEAVLITLCDQPLIDSSVLRNMLNQYQSHPRKILAATYADAPGVPAIFPRTYFQSLRSLPPQSGAKHLLQQHSANLMTIPINQAATDLDTPSDYENLKNTTQA